MFGAKRRHAQMLGVLTDLQLMLARNHNDDIYLQALTHETLGHVLRASFRIEEHMATRQQVADMSTRLVASAAAFTGAVDAAIARGVAKLSDAQAAAANAVNADDPALDPVVAALSGTADAMDAKVAVLNASA